MPTASRASSATSSGLNNSGRNSQPSRWKSSICCWVSFMWFPPLLFDRRFLSGGPANHRLYLRKVLADLTLCHLNIVVVLQVKPKRRRGSECLGEPERGIRGYPGFLVRQPLDARSGHAAGFRQRASRHFERDQKFFPENFTGVHGRELFGEFPGHSLFPDGPKSFHSMIEMVMIGRRLYHDMIHYQVSQVRRWPPCRSSVAPG